MGKSGTTFGTIGMILAAGAIGFAFVVWNGQNTINSDLYNLTDAFNNLRADFKNLTGELNNLTSTIVVGIWDELSDNLDYAPHNLQSDWLFEFGDNTLNNTDYISASNTNTRITLLQTGWYRIHLSVLMVNIDPSSIYFLALWKNGVLDSYLGYYMTVTDNPFYNYIDSSAFVYSDGTNYIELGYYSNDIFYPSLVDFYNQFTIEYVVM